MKPSRKFSQTTKASANDARGDEVSYTSLDKTIDKLTQTTVSRTSRFRASNSFEETSQLIVKESDISTSEDLGDKVPSRSEHCKSNIQGLGQGDSWSAVDSTLIMRRKRDLQRAVVEPERIRRDRVNQ